MSKYVDVENINAADYVETWECTCSEFGTQTVMSVDDLRYLPGADVAPVVRGKWCVSEYEFLNCSVCGESMYTGCNSTKEAIVLAKHWKRYCPNCGAKMDL